MEVQPGKQYRTRFHNNGRVTYWSVYRQVWVSEADPISISDQDLAAMPQKSRLRVIRMRGK